jgi:hypothetical protein
MSIIKKESQQIWRVLVDAFLLDMALNRMQELSTLMI